THHAQLPAEAFPGAPGQVVQGTVMRLLPLMSLLLSACMMLHAGSRAAEPPAPRPASASGQAFLDLTPAQAWQAALSQDPGHQAAISEREAGQAERAIGRAGLLPQVSASLGRSRLNGTLETPSPLGGALSEDLDYTVKTNEIRATQTLFDWSRFAEYRRGQAKADHSLAVFD